MSIDDETTFGRRKFIHRVGALLFATAAPTMIGGCLLDTQGTGRNIDGHIGHGPDAGIETDANPQETDGGIPDGGTDGGDAGCEYIKEDLPLMLFNQIRYDPNHEDVQQNMEDQRVTEGGLLLGQLFEAAIDSATAYTAAGFKARYDASPEVRTAMYNDLSDRLADTTCTTEQEDIQSAFDTMIGVLFDDNEGRRHFELRETNAIYFASARGNDGEDRTYMMMIGGIAPPSQEQTAEPVVLYLPNMDSTTALLQDIEEGGI